MSLILGAEKRTGRPEAPRLAIVRSARRTKPRAVGRSGYCAHGGAPLKMVHVFPMAALHCFELPAGPGSLKQSPRVGLHNARASQAGLLLKLSIALMQSTVF